MENTATVKIQWCENFIKATFAKLPKGITGIETGCFWKMAEASGLWVPGTYGTPMSQALSNLTKVETIQDDNGKFLYHVFKLTSKSKSL